MNTNMLSVFERLQNEAPMDSDLNSAHFHSRRAESHLKYGRYDDAINSHKEAVNFLTKAITESTIPGNIEHLKLQRDHHENIQRIIKRQKHEFAQFLLKNRLKIVTKHPEIVIKNEDIKNTLSEDIVTKNICPPSNTSDVKQDINDEKTLPEDIVTKNICPLTNISNVKQDNIDESEFFSLFPTDVKNDVNDNNEFFSIASDLKIDTDAYVDQFLDVVVINENDESDNEEMYLSL